MAWRLNQHRTDCNPNQGRFHYLDGLTPLAAPQAMLVELTTSSLGTSTTYLSCCANPAQRRPFSIHR